METRPIVFVFCVTLCRWITLVCLTLLPCRCPGVEFRTAGGPGRLLRQPHGGGRQEQGGVVGAAGPAERRLQTQVALHEALEAALDGLQLGVLAGRLRQRVPVHALHPAQLAVQLRQLILATQTGHTASQSTGRSNPQVTSTHNCFLYIIDN